MRFSRLPPYSSVRWLDERREELVQQIAVAAVQLDQVEADAVGALAAAANSRDAVA